MTYPFLSWAGYGRGLGSAVFSQPLREFAVKIIEMSLFAADFLCGHFLLFFLTIPCLVPGIDTLHSTMLCKFLTSISRFDNDCILIVHYDHDI
jgi:hypothetical protein